MLSFSPVRGMPAPLPKFGRNLPSHGGEPPPENGRYPFTTRLRQDTIAFINTQAELSNTQPGLVVDDAIRLLHYVVECLRMNSLPLVSPPGIDPYEPSLKTTILKYDGLDKYMHTPPPC